jgi:hypothetical protein
VYDHRPGPEFAARTADPSSSASNFRFVYDSSFEGQLTSNPGKIICSMVRIEHHSLDACVRQTLHDMMQ